MVGPNYNRCVLLCLGCLKKDGKIVVENRLEIPGSIENESRFLSRFARCMATKVSKWKNFMLLCNWYQNWSC